MGVDHDRSERVRRFLRETGWREPTSVRFLAAGEYNENYLVESRDEQTVFRINHGTQLDLEDQIGYEFTVLEIAAPSGVTPLPLHLCHRHPLFPRGALLMTFFDGRPLDYEADLEGAAGCLAAVHRLPQEPESTPLIVQKDPVGSIVEESRRLLSRHTEHPLPSVGIRVREYLDRVSTLAGHPAFGAESLCLVNTEVNSGNFVVDGTHVRLVDWEKAVLGHRYQDLGHFLVPTTTLWKTSFQFDAVERRRFLACYHAAAEPSVSLDELDERTDILERTILLRAYSWVYMAYAEYTSGSRPITNPDTFATMCRYLDQIDLLLPAW